MMEKKSMIYRNAVIGVGVLCAILLVALVYSVINYTSMLQNKDYQIASLNAQINDLQNQIKSLNSQIAAAGTNSQVQVSGTIQWTEIFRIEFVDARARDYQNYNLPNGTIQTSTPVLTDHSYSVLVIGGLSYEVRLYSSASISLANIQKDQLFSIIYMVFPLIPNRSSSELVTDLSFLKKFSDFAQHLKFFVDYITGASGGFAIGDN